MMQVLRAAQHLHLPDWMIGAGFVRNKVWDHLHNRTTRTITESDIDLIYYDASDLAVATERHYDNMLHTELPAPWSCKNQARMHTKHQRPSPYRSSEEALGEWVETATCIAVRLEDAGNLVLFAPHGISDLVQLIVRPTVTHRDDLSHFFERIAVKKWLERWPQLEVSEQ